jgi:hypothetical protein
MRKLDDEFFPNIQRSYLHMMARRTPVFPYIELLEWLIDHTDIQKCLINDVNGNCVRFFLTIEVQSYYNLRDTKEQSIRMLRESSINPIKKLDEYWEKMVEEPHREIWEKCAKCEKSWVKINKAMKDIGLPEFGMLDDFVDLRDIVKLHTEGDSLWAKEIAKVTDAAQGQVRQFMEH